MEGKGADAGVLAHRLSAETSNHRGQRESERRENVPLSREQLSNTEVPTLSQHQGSTTKKE